jgi:predicted amidophosphoribosyltransferase
VAPEICPNCGAEVPPKARACPECGADEKTGWSERAAAQRLGLPDDEFDYDEFVKEEFGEKKQAARPQIGWFWWVVAVGLILAFAIYFLRL